MFAKKRQRIYIFFLLLIIFSFLLMSFQAVYSQGLKNSSEMANEIAAQAGYETQEISVEKFIGQTITILLSFLGVIFIVLMVYGGYLWMTDRGNEDQVKKAKNLITAAVIGLVIIVMAYAISLFVLERISTGVLKDSASEGGSTSGRK